jgi:hypothetical protein
MYGQEHDSHNEDNMDESRSNVKREKSEQPKNDQNCSEHPKHVFNSFNRKLPGNQNSISQAQHGYLLLAGFLLSLIILSDRK